MKRTNLVLEEVQYQYLKDRAEHEGKSISALVRELIEAAICPSEDSFKNDPIFKIVGIARGKGRGAARHHDEILYRKER
jgi:predicted DNA-binding protein